MISSKRSSPGAQWATRLFRHNVPFNRNRINKNAPTAGGSWTDVDEPKRDIDMETYASQSKSIYLRI